MNLIEVRLSECVERFIDSCQKKESWKIYKEQNLIRTDSGFHKFILVDSHQLQSFRDAVRQPLTIIRDGEQYRTVKHNYTALISREPISAGILLLFEERPHLSDIMAIYDLGSAIKRPTPFSKINLTRSEVFVEFEKFVAETYKIKFPAYSVPELQNPPETTELKRPEANETLTPKEPLFRRLKKRILFVAPTQPPALDPRKKTIRDSVLPKPIGNFCVESHCCICIATLFARTKSLLT